MIKFMMAKIANAHSFIIETESGYETLLGIEEFDYQGAKTENFYC